MIRIELTAAVAFYLSLGILLLIGWFLFEKRRRSVRSRGPEGHVWECPVCFHAYVDSRSDGLSRCPRCGALHKHGEKRVQ